MSAIHHRTSASTLFAPAIALVLAAAIIFVAMAGQARASWPGASGTPKIEIVLSSAKPGCTETAGHLPEAQPNHAACSIGLSCFIFDGARDASHVAASLDAIFAGSMAARLDSQTIIPPTPPPKAVIVA